MNEELNKLLKKIVNDETYNYIQDHYDILKNESIISAGIDSLEYISILSELDETYGFDEEMIDSLETFSDVERNLMENKILPDEIKEILKEVDINPKVASAIWKKDSIYMIQNTIEYDQERLFNEIPGDRKQKIVEAVRKMEVEEDPLQYIISSALGCFVIESVIRGQDFIDLSIVNKIGINNKMRMGKGKYYTYAACHHCYNTVKKVPANYIVYSPCYRIEEYYNNYRKEKFNMFEIVTFDEFNKIESSKLEFIFFICEILNRNNVNDYKISLANDSFITDNKEKLLYQILSKSKIEILCFSKQETRYISVASVNMHRKSFIQKFHIIRNPLFESMCFGIGIDRFKNMFDEYNQIKV